MENLTITRQSTIGTGHAGGEYQARLPGVSQIGRLTFVIRDNVRIADHTLVPSELGGRGIAGKLVEALVADARAEGFRIKPACSYVAAAFAKHPEWADLLA